MDYRLPDPVGFSLNPAEVSSPVWQKLRSYYTQRLAELREQNDSLELSHEESVALRARIQEVKRTLALETVPPVFGP